MPNLSSEHQTIMQHEHFCQVTLVFESKEEHRQALLLLSLHFHPFMPVTPHLSRETQTAFSLSLLKEDDSVFDPQFPGYNGSTGTYQVKINIGPVKSPQQKSHLPRYAHDKLKELHERFDHLEQLSVFQCPEDVGITVEYLNPSFLVKKPQRGFPSIHCFC